LLDLVIRGGEVVTSGGIRPCDVGIHNERIAALAEVDTLLGKQVVSAVGNLVIPGGIDPHVHTAWPLPSFEGEPRRTGLPAQVGRAALHGGTTTMLDFALCEPGQSIAAAVAIKEQIWRESYVDWGLHVLLQGSIPPEVIDEIPDAISAGYPSFKLFTTDVTPERKVRRRVDLGHTWAVMSQTARNGGIVAIHGEDDDLLMFAYQQMRRAGRIGYEQMPEVHTAISEELAFSRVIKLARHVEGAAVYFVHVSSALGVDAVAEARADGMPVYGETLHNYACFTADAYRRPGGVIYHTYPSLKHADDTRRLWEGLQRGWLSTVATDGGSFPRAWKQHGTTIFDAVGGHAGVETRLPITYSEGVVKRGISLERFVELTSTNAAKLFGLYPRKGVIALGSDADIVVFDPSVRRVLQHEDLHDADYSIWDGWEVQGWPGVVILRGKVVVQGNEFRGKVSDGRRVPRKIAPEIRRGPAL